MYQYAGVDLYFLLRKEENSEDLTTALSFEGTTMIRFCFNLATS